MSTVEELLGAGGTIARWTAQGRKVVLAVCTNGDPMDDYFADGICYDGQCEAQCIFWW